MSVEQIEQYCGFTNKNCKSATLQTANITDIICAMFNKLEYLESKGKLSEVLLGTIKTMIDDILFAVSKIDDDIQVECMNEPFVELPDEVTSFRYGKKPINTIFLHILVAALINRIEHWCFRYDGGCIIELRKLLSFYQKENDEGKYSIVDFIYKKAPSSFYKDEPVVPVIEKKIPSVKEFRNAYSFNKTPLADMPLDNANIYVIALKMLDTMEYLEKIYNADPDFAVLKNMIFPILANTCNALYFDPNQTFFLVREPFIPSRYEVTSKTYGRKSMKEIFPIHILALSFCNRIKQLCTRGFTQFTGIRNAIIKTREGSREYCIVDDVFDIVGVMIDRRRAPK